MEETIAEYIDKWGESIKVVYGTHPDTGDCYTVFEEGLPQERFDMLERGELFTSDIHESVERKIRECARDQFELYDLVKAIHEELDGSDTELRFEGEAIARYEDPESLNVICVGRYRTKLSSDDPELGQCVFDRFQPIGYFFMTNSEEHPLRFNTQETVYANSYEEQQIIETEVKRGSQAGIDLEELLLQVNGRLGCLEGMAEFCGKE